MKIAYFDCFSGISGDMVVGALLDAGVPLRVVQEGIALLGLGPDRLQTSVRPIVRSQIYATKFDVLAPDGAPVERAAAGEEGPHHDDPGHHHTHAHHEHGHDPGHHHDHGHAHAHHGHDHAHHEHGGGPGAGHHHDHEHRPHHGHVHHGHDHDHGSHEAIAGMIRGSGLPAGVKDRALRIFREIAIAEARIHNTTPEDVHFHEVGALDSIADVVAVALCLDHLGIDEVYSAPVPLGTGGMIRTQHGIMPLPAPATLEILKGYPVMLTDVPFELTTPTGAGIIKALSHGTLAVQQMQVERIGFGAGTRELPDRPNLLRVVIGELVGAEERDTVTGVEANIDDMNPQVYPYLIERLLGSGASEAFLTPVIMKKGRPGMLLTVLAPSGAVDEVTKVIYQETTTIGVRYREMSRRKLPREEVLIPTEFGTVRMKKIESPDGIRIAPEYEECRRIAQERGIPLHEVLMRLEEAARDPEHLRRIGGRRGVG